MARSKSPSIKALRKRQRRLRRRIQAQKDNDCYNPKGPNPKRGPRLPRARRKGKTAQPKWLDTRPEILALTNAGRYRY